MLSWIHPKALHACAKTQVSKCMSLYDNLCFIKKKKENPNSNVGNTWKGDICISVTGSRVVSIGFKVFQ